MVAITPDKYLTFADRRMCVCVCCVWVSPFDCRVMHCKNRLVFLPLPLPLVFVVGWLYSNPVLLSLLLSFFSFRLVFLSSWFLSHSFSVLASFFLPLYLLLFSSFFIFVPSFFLPLYLLLFSSFFFFVSSLLSFFACFVYSGYFHCFASLSIIQVILFWVHITKH